MDGSDQPSDGAIWRVQRALERLRRTGQLCAEPARRPNWLRIGAAAFLVVIVAGLPATLAAAPAAASGSATSARADNCQDTFDLSASSGPAGGDVTLSWCVPVGPYSYYNVEEGTGPGNESNIVTVPITATSYVWPGLTGGLTYYFVVVAVNTGGSDVWSNEAWAPASTGTYDGPISAPGPPTLVSASPGDSQVILSWTAPASGGVTQYNVYQGDSPGGESTDMPVATTSGTTVTVPNLTNGRTYYFVVTAEDAGVESSASNEMSTTPTAGAGNASPGNASPGNASPGNASPGNTPGGQFVSPPGGGQTEPSSGSALTPIILAGIGLLVVVVAVVALRRLRGRGLPPSAPSVQVVRDAGPSGQVNVQPTGTQPTVAVRIERHPGVSTTLIEEVQR